MNERPVNTLNKNQNKAAFGYSFISLDIEFSDPAP